MAWITPKEDWDTDDLIMDSDLNRIEGNTAANRKRYEVSGNCGDLAAAVSATSYINYFKGFFSVEDGEDLILKNARFMFANSNLRLRIEVDIGGGLATTWTSSSNEGDVEPDDIVYSNTTGSTVTGFYQIEAYNTAGSPQSTGYYDSWVLTFEKEDAEVSS